MSRVLVPISLEALVVRTGDAPPACAQSQWGVPQRPPAKSPSVRQDLAPQPFADQPAARPVGVHLHWAMPDALAVQRVGKSGFPALPCRWLVVRLDGLATAAQPRRVTTWLIPNIHDVHPTVVVNGHLHTQPIGPATTVVTLRGRGSDGPHPSWGLSYDDSLGRLAFHDPVDDTGATGPITYAVFGWYTHAKLDPLTPPAGTPANPTWFVKAVLELGWLADLPAGAAPPDSTLYHGTALAIGWPGVGWPGDDGGRLSSPAGGIPMPGDVGVALADTLSAATAALLDGQAAPGTAALSEAVLDGHVAQLAQADGAGRVDEARHQSRFRSEASSRSTKDAIFVDEPTPPAAAPNVRVAQPHVARALAATTPRAVDASLATLHHAATAPPPPLTTGVIPVSYPVPRGWRPGDPVLAISGLGRTVRHGGDGRFHELGLLHCRLTGQTVTSAAASTLPAWTAATDVPAEVGALLAEVALLDPGSVADLASAGTLSAAADARASWWQSWATDWTKAPANTGWQGVLPSPVAVTRPSLTWNPLRIDWEIVYTPTPVTPRYWSLGELDYSLAATRPASPQAPIAVTGSGWLSPAPAKLLAAVAGPGNDFGTADLVSATLENMVASLRNVPRGVWVGPSGIDDSPTATVLAAEAYAARARVAGTWRLGRVRAVDTFGQTLALYDPSNAAAAQAPAPTIPQELAADAAGALALRPRFTAATSIKARFLNVLADSEITAGQNPLVGFLVPSPLDASLEFFGPEGDVLCRMRPDPRTGASVLEAAPGGPTGTTAAAGTALLGAAAAALNAPLAIVAGAVVAAERRVAAGERVPASARGLAALLKLIDLTRSAVDVTGRGGDDQLALLLGQPVAVFRLGVTLTVDDPQATDLASLPVPCRLGSLTNLTDGLLAWIAEDSPDQIHPIHQVVVDAGSDDGSDVDLASAPLIGSPTLWLQPGKTRTLVLIATPHADVSLVTGLVPLKRLQIEREWVDRPLRRLVPAIAIDAALRDPAAIALPTPGGLHGTWTWWRRPQAGGPWEGAAISTDPPSAQPSRPVTLEDGYLRFTLTEDPDYPGVPMQVVAIRRQGPQKTIQFLKGLQPDPGRASDSACRFNDGTSDWGATPTWQLPVDSVVEMIESGRFSFFVCVKQGNTTRQVRLVTDYRRNGSKYPRTDWNDSPDDNLAHLPTF